MQNVQTAEPKARNGIGNLTTAISGHRENQDLFFGEGLPGGLRQPIR